MKEIEELQEQTTDELRAFFRDLSKEIFEHKNEINTTRKVDKPHLIPMKKRTRARILTILNQRGEKL